MPKASQERCLGRLLKKAKVTSSNLVRGSITCGTCVRRRRLAPFAHAVNNAASYLVYSKKRGLRLSTSSEGCERRLSSLCRNGDCCRTGQLGTVEDETSGYRHCECSGRGGRDRQLGRSCVDAVTGNECRTYTSRYCCTRGNSLDIHIIRPFVTTIGTISSCPGIAPRCD